MLRYMENVRYKLSCTNNCFSFRSQSYSGMVAGTGWFVNTDVPEGTMLTNAHVVRDAKTVSIRMPCNHV